MIRRMVANDCKAAVVVGRPAVALALATLAVTSSIGRSGGGGHSRGGLTVIAMTVPSLSCLRLYILVLFSVLQHDEYSSVSTYSQVQAQKGRRSGGNGGGIGVHVGAPGGGPWFYW